MATLLVAALMLTVTGDVKRMLAYSSMENMGLIAIAAAAGTTLAIAALLLHVLAHGIGKTVLFLAGGQLQAAHGSTAIADITGVVRRSRLVGASFAVGLIVLLGLPPFAMFASELAIARSLADARLAWVLGAAMLLIAVAFAALVRNCGPDAARRRAAVGAPTIAVPATVAAALLVGVTASIVAGDHRGPAHRPVHHRRQPGRSVADETESGAAPGFSRRARRTRPKNSWPTASDWPWWRPTTTATGCGSCTCSWPGRPDRRVELECIVPASDPALPSLAYLSFPAGRFEREMADLYGIRPIGHPRPRRLVRHAHWPEDWHPMRADAGPAPQFAPTGRFPFVTVEGTGVYEIPVGPVHAGLIEPGHFRFSVVGETVLRLKARLWFVHRGLEKLFQGRPATGAADLAERVSGDTSAAHALAHSLAIEDALGIEVARRSAPAAGLARRTRTALQPRRRSGRAGQRRRLFARQRPRPTHPRTTAAPQRGGDRAPVAARRHLPRRRDTAPAARPRAIAVDRHRPRRSRRADTGQHRGLRPVRRHLGAGL